MQPFVAVFLLLAMAMGIHDQQDKDDKAPTY